MFIMLGLMDLLRAVKGTAKMVLRRVPSKVGVGMVAVLWVGAVGAVFAYAHEDLPGGGSDAKENASTAHRDDGDSRTSTSERDKDGDGYDDVTGSPSWTVVDPSSSTSTSTGADAVPGDDLGGPTGSSPDSPPSSDSPDPSWTPSSTTTAPTSGAPTTTAPPTTTTPPSGGILGGLLDLLGGGKG